MPRCFSPLRLCEPWTVAHQAPLSTGFPVKNAGVGCHFLPQGDLPHSGIEPVSPASPAFAGRFFTLSHLGTHSTQVQSFLDMQILTLAPKTPGYSVGKELRSVLLPRTPESSDGPHSKIHRIGHQQFWSWTRLC